MSACGMIASPDGALDQIDFWQSRMTFKVRIEPSGHEFTVEDNETILEAALRHGYTLPHNCRDGECGTCKGKILSGEIDHGMYDERALPKEERRAGKALFCRARPRSDVVIEAKEIGAAKGIIIKTFPCRVVKMEKATHDVMILWLRLPQNERLRYLAGQHVEILLRDGNRRSFSLASAPHANTLLQLHVRHVPGGLFSGHVFTNMKERDLLRLHGPLGTFFLREDSNRPAILVAGGTGFAPIKAILEHAFAAGIKRPIYLFWGARTRRDLYMDDLPLAWEREYENFRYIPVLSEPSPHDDWRGRTGWVHEAVLGDFPDLGRYEVYASGPPPMIEAAKNAFKRRDLPEDQLFYDSFEFAHTL